MLADDRPDYPMTFLLRLAFTGCIDRQRFAAALNEALTLHPLLRAQVRGSAETRPSWIEASDPQPQVSWNLTANATTSGGGPWIDLGQETGLRLSIQERESTTQLLCQFHHSCCDGVGALHFVETLLTAYDSPRTQVALLLGSRYRSSQRLAARDHSGASWKQRMLQVPRDALDLLRFFMHAPLPLGPPDDRRAAVRASSAGLQSHIFTEQESATIRETARSERVTINDLLLRDLFLVLADWNRQQGPPSKYRPIRIAMPMNMRGPTDQITTAINAVSMAFIDRKSRQMADPRDLLGSIRAETLEAKRSLTGPAMLKVLRVLGALPSALPFVLNLPRCLASSVLSNLGILFAQSPLRRRNHCIVAGGLVLDRVEFFPPIRPFTHTAFGVLTYANRLVLNLRFDSRKLTGDEGSALLATLVRQVTGSRC